MIPLAPTSIQDGGKPTLVGFSGGLDSTVLLHRLATEGGPGLRLRAIHVHHGLYPDADAWAAHCQKTCDAIGVPLTIVNTQVVRDGGGREAAARKARYAAFEDALRDDEVLALAHHRDDQAETFLLRALRASGPDGLGAMRAWQRFGRGWLWRPLLECPRSELLADAMQHQLQWIEDSSNGDTSFDRNFLRHRVLPLLRERWPHADAAFARSAALAAEAGELLADDDAGALQSVRTSDPRTINVGGLRRLPVARRARVLRRWIADLGLPPLPAQGVSRIEADMIDAAPDSDAAFRWAGALVRRWRDALHADVQRTKLPDGWQVRWDGRCPLALPGGGSLSLHGAEAFDAPLRVHARLGGERIQLAGRSHSHSLKHLLQQAGVPPWTRQRLPLLSAEDGTLLAAGDRVRSGAFAAWLHSRDASLVLDDGED